MIDTKALRNKVLDLAIQGKLTEQLESDGTAEELFAQIQEEKQRLIKEGKIKKEKPLPPVADEEIPFEIPNNWKLIRFSDIIKLQSGQDLTNQEYNDNNVGIPYITGASNYNTDGSLIINRWTETPKAIAENGDILISCKGTVGKITILQIDKVHIARQIMGIRTYYISNVFVEMYLQSVVNGIKNAQKGLIPGIERNDILSLAFCLPPLAEQKRIVERVEEIFKLLDIIDEAQAKYSADAEILKSKLITMGIQGKLTEQLESDGTAEELFVQIQEEKQRLIKEGKIKKEKPLPPVADEEIPFEIPSGWKWVHMGELFQHNTGKALNSSNTDGKMLEYITTSNVYWDKFDLKVIKQMPFSETEIEKCTITKGDFLICEGGDIGRSAIWNFDYDMRIQNHLHRLRAYLPDISQKFYYYIMKLYKEIGLINGRGIGLQGFSSTRVHNLVVPLPPLAEQKRIADKLDEILRVIG